MNTYKDLFAQISKTTCSLAEQVANYDTANNDKNGADAALIMRDDFNHLAKKIIDNEESLTKDDYVKLLLGTMVVTNNLEDRKNMIEKTITKYKEDLLPKLERIVNEGDNFDSLIKELFNSET